MLFRASLVVAALFAQSALSATCTPGNYRDSAGNCHPCADGYYRDSYTFTGTSSCSPCDAGKQSNSGHTDCTTCPLGTYSSGGTMCGYCPLGQQPKGSRKGCDKCDEGYYNDKQGEFCKSCPGGTFNNVEGAKTCCQCCAGYYSTSSSGSKSCTRCPTTGPGKKPFSDIGSDSSNDCKAAQGTSPTPPDSCAMVSNNFCPNPSGGGPTGSPITRRKRDMTCTKGFESCPRFSGRGGSDCVDTENDPESCGGCLTLDGSGPGTDCTAIKGASATRCVRRSCVVDSCRRGWVKSLDGTSCTLVSRTTGSSGSETAGFHAQDVDAKKKRSSAKRAIRANIY